MPAVSTWPFVGEERGACGVGFTVDRNAKPSHKILQDTLSALDCEEHRGACAIDQRTGDGAGIMTDIPFELFGFEPGSVAVASLFAPQDAALAEKAYRVFEETFAFFGLQVVGYRDVPFDPSVLGHQARDALPRLRQAFIERPRHVHTDDAFNTLLYHARQLTRTKEKQAGIHKQFYFCSLSSNVIIYKALTRGGDLARFYPDLRDSRYRTRFGVFHRRFSTNTATTWDKAQPFRLIAHNGEINTIAGNRAWAYSREQALGLPIDELLTHAGISDSGNFNEMVEALKYRSSIPYIADVLSIMIPPAQMPSDLHRLWSRAMEPWDGPAFLIFCDGVTLGARLDRNGFRPCRWALTADRLYLASEAGSFAVNEAEVLQKGTVKAGSGLTVDLSTGEVDLEDSARSIARSDAKVDSRLARLTPHPGVAPKASVDDRFLHFGFTLEDVKMMLEPMVITGKEPIGSMGNTARLAVLSEVSRPFFDYFFQGFAQVTNPPVDYLRERIVSDLSMYLGRRPNVFAPKELIPPFQGIELPSPVLRLGQMEALRAYELVAPFRSGLAAIRLDTTLPRNVGKASLMARLRKLGEEAVAAAERGYTMLVLTDERASLEQAPLPSLLALAAVTRALDACGLRLRSSIIVHSGEVRSAHHLACLVGFGADAVCPYLPLEFARTSEIKGAEMLSPEEREENLAHALETGLLRTMAKMGISVARSYQGSKLFTCLGLGKDITDPFFPGTESPIGGISMEQLAEHVLRPIEHSEAGSPKLANTYQFKEHPRGREGERHSMTAAQSTAVHRLVRSQETEERQALYEEYLKLTESSYPISLRHLFQLREATAPLPMREIQPIEEILCRFGSGAMSFGAISAEAQRDIIIAMKRIRGRSNSGEGGENPYYWSAGISASCKQVASARFGVTGQYLISGEELQIKMAQGAKPGEGGQLMKEKVDETIAHARHASPGIDLISPPPLHDIYSIEDLKELIFELRQFHPASRINVKLVSGYNIGTIAVGVAKAGADSIHISGGDGGTGAAALTSMKHAGLPWEIGLVEANHALIENGLREAVQLRVDGGLSTGFDIVMAAIFGADQFDFGKLLLVAEGCIMARVCEKNTCPTGIATHAERFKKKYKGSPEQIVALLEWIAQDVRRWLAKCGVPALDDLFGRTDLLSEHPAFRELVHARGLRLDGLLTKASRSGLEPRSPFTESVSSLNDTVREDCAGAVRNGGEVHREYRIRVTDRAVPATLCGVIAEQKHRRHLESLRATTREEDAAPAFSIQLRFQGSAGQGFGFLLEEGVSIRLEGEANDSVCKSMSGGKMVIVPSAEAKFAPEQNSIIGNCALYGATGGTVYIHGRAGDRFAVRNSGATAVVEGTGLHACEYMTSGRVIILGPVRQNLGAGMTGGAVFLLDVELDHVNHEYLAREALGEDDQTLLLETISDFAEETGSTFARELLANTDMLAGRISKWVPRR